MEQRNNWRGRWSRYRLFRTRNIYDRQGTEQLFLSAVRENCAYHYRHCRDMWRMPVLPTLFFKHH